MNTGLEIIFYIYYSGDIASTGHSSTHVPQSVHKSGSITYFVLPSEIASTGQTSAQAPHEVHSSEITCGIIFPLHNVFEIYVQLNVKNNKKLYIKARIKMKILF